MYIANDLVRKWLKSWDGDTGNELKNLWRKARTQGAAVKTRSEPDCNGKLRPHRVAHGRISYFFFCFFNFF